MIICKNCGTENGDDSAFCKGCGSKLEIPNNGYDRTGGNQYEGGNMNPQYNQYNQCAETNQYEGGNMNQPYDWYNQYNQYQGGNMNPSYNQYNQYPETQNIYAPRPKKNGKPKNKKLIAIAASIILIVAIAGTAVYLKFFNPNSPDGIIREYLRAAEDGDADRMIECYPEDVRSYYDDWEYSLALSLSPYFREYDIREVKSEYEIEYLDILGKSALTDSEIKELEEHLKEHFEAGERFEIEDGYIVDFIVRINGRHVCEEDLDRKVTYCLEVAGIVIKVDGRWYLCPKGGHAPEGPGISGYWVY